MRLCAEADLSGRFAEAVSRSSSTGQEVSPSHGNAAGLLSCLPGCEPNTDSYHCSGEIHG